MKAMKLMFYLALLISGLNTSLSASKYFKNPGIFQDIKTTFGDPHPYSGIYVEPFANLNGADLSGANLSDAYLWGAKLNDSNLAGADLSNANLLDSRLRNANLPSVNFFDANLTYSILSGANLSGAYLLNADLSYVSFLDANLSGADLSNAINVGLAYTWSGANLDGATLPDGFDQDWFESQGAKFAVPELSTYALLLGVISFILVAQRRR